MVRIHPATSIFILIISLPISARSRFLIKREQGQIAFVRRACSLESNDKNEVFGFDTGSFGFVSEHFPIFARCDSHDGASQRYTIRGCARETVFFFFLTFRRNGARVHVEARVKHGGLMNYNISLNILFHRLVFHRFLEIEALSHQCVTTTPGKATLAPTPRGKPSFLDPFPCGSVYHLFLSFLFFSVSSFSKF